MIIIDTPASMARALDQPLDPDLKQLLALRRDRLADAEDSARFIIVEPNDSLAAAEEAIGFPMLLEAEPTWEWAERHGSIIEVAFIFGDAADVLLVPDRDNIDADLTDLLHRHAAADLEQRGPVAF